MVHLHSGVSVIKRNEIIPFTATWMDLEMTILSEVREDKGVTHVWNLVFLNDTNELIYKQKQI